MIALGYGYTGNQLPKCMRLKGIFNIGGGILINIQLVISYLVYITHRYIYPTTVSRTRLDCQSQPKTATQPLPAAPGMLPRSRVDRRSSRPLLGVYNYCGKSNLLFALPTHCRLSRHHRPEKEPK